MREKKLTQQQRIVSLEKAVTNLFALIQAVIQKLPNEKNNLDTDNDSNNKSMDNDI